MSKINDYALFVDKCTSEASKDTSIMCDRLDYLRLRLLNEGLRSARTRSRYNKIDDCLDRNDGREWRIVKQRSKKKIFQSDSKFKSDEIFHMKRELGRCSMVLDLVVKH